MAQPDPAAAAKPLPAKPLDLRIGDIRRYMTPEAYQAALSEPDELDTVVVEARPLVPLDSGRSVFRGILGLFAPVLKPPPPREPIDKIPPPIFRWGP